MVTASPRTCGRIGEAHDAAAERRAHARRILEYSALLLLSISAVMAVGLWTDRELASKRDARSVPFATACSACHHELCTRARVQGIVTDVRCFHTKRRSRR